MPKLPESGSGLTAYSAAENHYLGFRGADPLPAPSHLTNQSSAAGFT